jgi:periplasmic protein CpxP/Spy
MRLKLALSTAVASLLFAAPVLAEQPPANAPANPAERAHRREMRMERKLERMEHRLERAVERGRLTQDDTRAQLQAGGGQLTEEQRQQLHQRRDALREKVRAAVKAPQPQGT